MILINSNEIKNLINREGLNDELIQKSLAMSESDRHSFELWLTIWKDGKATLSLTQRGSDYPPETYDRIKEIITLPRVSVYDNYDIQVALDYGISEDDIPEDAKRFYKENFDIDEYLEGVDF